MQSAAALFGMLALLLVIGVPVLAIVAYVRVGAVKSAAQAEAALLIRRITRWSSGWRRLKGLVGAERCGECDSCARAC